MGSRESMGTWQGLGSLLGSNRWSDMTITVKGHRFNVHRAVVCSQSDFFDAAMTANHFQEGITGTIDLPEDDPVAISMMLQWLYTGTYSVPGTVVIRDGERYGSLVLHTQVYILGDKYLIDGLVEYSKKRFNSTLELEWTTPSFIRALHLMYGQTQEDDRALKSVALRGVARHYTELMERDDELFIVLSVFGGLRQDVRDACRMRNAAMEVSVGPVKICQNCRYFGAVRRLMDGNGTGLGIEHRCARCNWDTLLYN